jgi:hypothetical protein
VGGGALALDALWLFAAFLVLVVLAATALAARRFLLERGGGTVECGLRSPAGQGAWRLGVASYQGDELCWYDALGVLLRPEHVLHRRSLTVLSRRPSLPSEAATFGPQRVVIEVWTQPAPESADEHVEAHEHLELAMTEEALTGFLAWLEASPPGSHLQDIA